MEFYDHNQVEVMFSAETIHDRVSELGAQITEEYLQSDAPLVMIGVLKGSFLFMADLCRAIDLPLEVDFLGLSSYGHAQESTGVVRVTQDLSRSIEGKHVLIVEDIIDTGLTMQYLLENLSTRRPKTVRVASLLSKPARSQVKIEIDYLGFEIPDRFVIGYGLDFASKFRNLPFIGVNLGKELPLNPNRS
jgi:hypoxanthine phosphoribosyltransferase